MNSLVESKQSGRPEFAGIRECRRWINDFLVAHRVRVSALLGTGLVLRALTSAVQPHALLDRHDVKSLIGSALLVAGVGIRSWAAGVLRKNKELATTGPYAITRNPLYLGSLFILAGFASLLNEEVELVVLAGPLVALYGLQVLHEERALSDRFESSWAQFASKVPRFLPRRWPDFSFGTWRMQNWLGNREYRACAAVLFGLLAMELWRVS